MKDFLFVHIPKTGGNSIKNSMKVLDNSYGHHHAKKIKSIINNFDHFYKIAIVRNTWDRIHSIWKHRRYGTQIWEAKGPHSTQLTFNEYIDVLYSKFENCKDISLTSGPELWCQPQLNWLLDTNGNMLVDEIGRFEDLDSFYSKIYNINPSVFKHNKIIHLNKSNKGINYKESYTNDSINKVYEIYENEINFFNYEY